MGRWSGVWQVGRCDNLQWRTQRDEVADEGCVEVGAGVGI